LTAAAAPPTIGTVRWLAPVAVLVGVVVVLSILGLQGSFTIGGLTIFLFGVVCGRLVGRNHGWVAAAGACVAATVGLIAIGLHDQGEDPWWELIAFVMAVGAVSAAAVWCAGVWVGARMPPHS